MSRGRSLVSTSPAVVATWVLCLLAGCGGSPFGAISTSMGGGGSGGNSSSSSGAGGTGGAGGIGVLPEAPAGGNSPVSGAGGGAGEARGGGSQDDSEVNAGGASGGAGGAGTEACPSAVGTPYQVGFFPELQTETSQEIHPFFKLSTTAAPVLLQRISLRYYFSKEVDAVESGSCYWVTGDRCANVELSWHDVEAPTPSADRYLELRFVGEQPKLTSLEPVEVRVGFVAARELLRQSNDYSFDNSALAPTAAEKFPYKPWPRVTLYVDGELVWGNEPCP